MTLSLGLSGVASADEPRPTIVLLAEAEDPFALRVAAELRELGFEAVLQDPLGAPTSRPSLEAAARSAGAAAAVRAVPSEHGVEVWIADRVTGKTLLREMHEADAGAEQTLALRTVELLRASLLEVRLPDANAGEVRLPAALRTRLVEGPAPAPPPDQATPLRLSFAGGLTVSPGGFGAAPCLVPGLDWMFSEHVGLVVLGSLPLDGARVERAGETATLSVWLAGGAVRLLPAAPDGRWAPSVELGLLAVSLSGSSETEPGAAPTTASGTGAAPFVRAGIAFALTSGLRLRADLLAGGLTQAARVRLASGEEGTWGSPFVLPSLGIDARWF